MELTKEERQIVANLLSQISVPVKDAVTVITIINKLQTPTAPTQPEAPKDKKS